MKILLIMILASVTYAAEAPKPFVFGKTVETCKLVDGKLKADNWEDCAYGVLQYAGSLEQRLAQCLTPKPASVAPKKK